MTRLSESAAAINRRNLRKKREARLPPLRGSEVPKHGESTSVVAKFGEHVDEKAKHTRVVTLGDMSLRRRLNKKIGRALQIAAARARQRLFAELIKGFEHRRCRRL